MRALISVSDKDNIIEFAKSLKDLNWDIISTGNTSKILKENGVENREVSDITQFPEILEGRVKTLNPKIHGGILARNDNTEDKKTLERHDIKKIDMVVVNLYPFRRAYKNNEFTIEEKIEQIDIGGPAMIRAAAKNFKDTIVLVDSKDYYQILKEFKDKKEISVETRRYLAKKAFNHTAKYDSMISKFFNEMDNDEFPDELTISYKKEKTLRYGENPHQKAALYSENLREKEGINNAKKIQGKDLSYNNISDYNEAIDIIKDFEEPTAVGIKHGSPCAIASSENILEAYEKAYSADPKSIFGGIVILNREVTKKLAEKLNKIFLEIIIAPSFTREAVLEFEKKPNLRVIKYEENCNRPKFKSKYIDGGLLIQTSDELILNERFEIATEKKPEKKEMEDLEFAFKVVKNAKSNAIVLAKNKMTISIGQGQVSRIWALENAIKQAKEVFGKDLDGVVLASDGFFPFTDCIEIAYRNNIKSIIQPGGSINDIDSINKANEYGIKMVITNVRHFKH